MGGALGWGNEGGGWEAGLKHHTHPAVLTAVPLPAQRCPSTGIPARRHRAGCDMGTGGGHSWGSHRVM